MKVIKWLDEYAEESIMIVLLLGMTVVMGMQIISRYVFQASLTWSEEITRYMFIWSAFLSVSYCTKRRISIKIDQIVTMLPLKVSAVFKIIEKIIMLSFFVYMTYFAYDFFMAGVISGQVSPACGIPMYLIQVSPFLGFALTIVRIVQSMIHEFSILRGKAEA